jgi:putative membrane protein insertion efficiency factor
MRSEPQRSTPILNAVFGVYRRVISPMLHACGWSRCIFLPTCSEYAYMAIARHGVFKGLALAAARIARCHPFSKGGLDPVP